MVEEGQKERMHRGESGAAGERPVSKFEIFGKGLECPPIYSAKTSEGSCVLHEVEGSEEGSDDSEDGSDDSDEGSDIEVDGPGFHVNS
eukprot:superscaffoldBa00000214_g2799